MSFDYKNDTLIYGSVSVVFDLVFSMYLLEFTCFVVQEIRCNGKLQ